MTGGALQADAAASGEGVALTTRGPLATITLSRPASRNAMRLSDWLELPGLIAAAERDRAVSLLVVRGAGGRFGAGNDISEFGALRRDPALAKSYGRAMADAMAAVEGASKPVVAAVEGVCYGASVALALAADMRIASDTSVFAVTPAKLGALYLRSDLHRLAAAVGRSRARLLIFTAEPVDAAGALRMGLVDAVHSSATFETELDRLAAAVERGSPFTLRRSKEMLLALDEGRAPPETEESLSWFVEATQGPDFARGVEAFLAKRAPCFD